MPAPDRAVDVVIVGFGPVGALLAGLLGRRGVNVLVLERDHDVFPLPRAAHVDHTGLRAWQELGLLDRLLPRMRANGGLDFVTANNELLARIPGEGLSASGLPFSMYFFQPELDRAVRAMVSALPSVSVGLGTRVTDVLARDNGVLIRASAGEGSLSVEAQWVVACDGASSAIRESLGATVEDLQFEESWLVVDLLRTGDDGDIPGGAICRCDPSRPTYSIPMPLRRHRFEFRLMPGDDPALIIRPEQIRALVAPWLSDAEVQVERSAIYAFHGLVADQWRHGRVLLAGDAAHQMPPFLGQGMCSGLRDAANLAWKLDLVISGTAPGALLDTYPEERRPHVRSVVDAAVSIGRVICTVDPREAARRDRRMLSDHRPPTRRIPFTLPPLQPGPIILENGGDLFIQPQADGRRLDDVVGQRFAVLSRGFELTGHAASWWTRTMGALVASVTQLPPGSAFPVLSWLDSNDSDIVIVRPDRYVMWAGTDLDAVTSKVADILSRATRMVLPFGHRIGRPANRPSAPPGMNKCHCALRARR
jgi:3-(3-hydroxy-phenyl)propionate hydroxylase